MLSRMPMETIKIRDGTENLATGRDVSAGRSGGSVQCSVFSVQCSNSRNGWRKIVNTVSGVALATTIVGCAPAGPRALLKGAKLIEQGKYGDAVAKLEIATSILTTNAQAWNYLGLACHYSDQAAEAEKAYQR